MVQVKTSRILHSFSRKNMCSPSFFVAVLRAGAPIANGKGKGRSVITQPDSWWHQVGDTGERLGPDAATLQTAWPPSCGPLAVAMGVDLPARKRRRHRLSSSGFTSPVNYVANPSLTRFLCWTPASPLSFCSLGSSFPSVTWRRAAQSLVAQAQLNLVRGRWWRAYDVRSASSLRTTQLATTR